VHYGLSGVVFCLDFDICFFFFCCSLVPLSGVFSFIYLLFSVGLFGPSKLFSKIFMLGKALG
jgi:hypothetical protein